MRKIFISIILLLPMVMAAQTNELKRVDAESMGIPSKAIIELFDSLMVLPQTDIHSVMVMRHGNVVGEMYPQPYAAEYRHTMYSCSKTFVSAAIGIAISENRLRLDDRVAPFFADVLPDSISRELSNMTVRHLLTMNSGITPDWNMRNICSNWIQTYLAKPMVAPGSKFMYDSMATYLLSAIVQKVTGDTLLNYLKKHIFSPMHITEVAWEVSPEGYNTGGWGLHIQSESLAKFGQLLLNRGLWEGKQLIPALWVDEMMKKQVKTSNNNLGYGYQMWPCEYPTASRADGAYGQYILVIPNKDMVVVITECTGGDGGRQRQLVWDSLLPQVKDTPLQKTKFSKLLKEKKYSLPLAKGKLNIKNDVFGKTYSLKPNKLGWKQMCLKSAKNGIILEVTDDTGITIPIALGYNKWDKTSTDAKPVYSIQAQGRMKGIDSPYIIAGSYGWKNSNSINIILHYVNWITVLDMSIMFNNNSAEISLKFNNERSATKIKCISNK